MDKETLSNYGWVVCVILVLAIMISLATPFGSVIRNKVAGTVESFKSNSEEVLDNVGGASSFDDLGGGGSGGAGGAGGGEPAHSCTDANTDYHCDECNAVIPHTCETYAFSAGYDDEGPTIEVCSLCDAHECAGNYGPWCDYCGVVVPHEYNEYCDEWGNEYCADCGAPPDEHVDPLS